MKKLRSLLIIICMSFLTAITCSASEPSYTTISTTVQPLDSGYYLETTVEITNHANSLITNSSDQKTVSGKKTTSLKSVSGSVLCSLTINATFTYDQKTSKCTSRYASSTAPDKYWKVINVESTKSKNTATATGIARETINSISNDTSLKVTLTCSASGKLS